MEKIVILCGPDEEDRMLTACLRILFPECEIQVQPKEEKLMEETSYRSRGERA
jgi:hypothetical protein